MKKKVISALSILWKIAIPLLSAVIGLKIVEKFNVFQILHIIGDADKAFDVCTTVYFAIVDVALLSFAEWIKNTFFTPQIIQVTLSKPGDMVQKSSVPDLLLYENRPCEARLTVKISAKKKTCKDLKLTLEGINFATMQLPAASTEASVDANGNFVIDLEKMFGNQELANTIQTFRILFSKEPVNGICQSELYPKLSKEPLFLTFDTNKLIIRTEG